MRLEGLPCPPRRRLRPEILDQPVDRDDAAVIHEENREERALLRGAQRHRRALAADLQGPEHPKLQRHSPKLGTRCRRIREPPSATTIDLGKRESKSEEIMDVDVAVLGGGPGGYTAAIRAAQLGARVACIEKEPELGGTCLRVGCIPTKAWVQTAFSIKEAEETFGKLGVKVGEPQLDFAVANEWKAGVVKQMTQGVAGLFKANGVEWVKGYGRFKDVDTIAVEGGEDVTFKSAVIATGSFPLRPPIDGLDS